MMFWLSIAALTLAAFAVGALLLRTKRNLWSLLAAVMVFGLAGYAWQGSPGYVSAPAKALLPEQQDGNALVDARRAFFEETDVPSNFVIVADGFMRRGEFERAAGILGGVVAENPDDGEAWLALHLALVEHAGGRKTKPSDFALKQAGTALKDNPGPAFFAGVDALRAGEIAQTREIWAEALARTEEDTPGRDYLAERVEGLDRMLEALAEQQRAAGAPSGPQE